MPRCPDAAERRTGGRGRSVESGAEGRGNGAGLVSEWLVFGGSTRGDVQYSYILEVEDVRGFLGET